MRHLLGQPQHRRPSQRRRLSLRGYHTTYLPTSCLGHQWILFPFIKHPAQRHHVQCLLVKNSRPQRQCQAVRDSRYSSFACRANMLYRFLYSEALRGPIYLPRADVGHLHRSSNNDRRRYPYFRPRRPGHVPSALRLPVKLERRRRFTQDIGLIIHHVDLGQPVRHPRVRGLLNGHVRRSVLLLRLPSTI